MKGSLKILGTAVAVLGVCAAQAQPSLVHVKSIDISSSFSAGGAHGDTVGALAWDGKNLYIAGFAVPAADSPVGVVKVEGLFGASPTFSPLISLTQAAASRSSYLVYHNGSIYLGTGLGDGTQNPAKTGVRKFDAMTGAQDNSWSGGDGVLVPNEVDGGNGRLECLERDPRTDSLAMLARGRGITFRRSFGDASALPNILSVPTLFLGGTTTGVRDLSFNPANGDMYMRVDNSVFYAERTADNSVAGGVSNEISNLSFRSDNVFAVMINVLYMPTEYGDVLVFNRRTGGGTPEARFQRVFVHSGTGATWNPHVELLGNELLEDGTEPSAFSFDVFNFAYGDAADRSRGDANMDGIVNDDDLLMVLFEFGTENADADLNNDGLVDDEDLLIVLFNFGLSPKDRYLFIISSNLSSDRLDVYRVAAGGEQ